MASLAFDTLAFSKRLRGVFTPDQAETLAEAFVAGANEQLATKTDLASLEQRMDLNQRELEARLDARFAQIDARFAQIDLRFAQTDTRIAEGFNKVIIWLGGTIIAAAGLTVALIKLLP